MKDDLLHRIRNFRNINLIFLDIDGVLRVKTRGDRDVVDRDLVEHLNWLLDEASKNCYIVFNTSWNRLTLPKLRWILQSAGFCYGDRLLGKTNGNEGGGALILQWLRDNDRVGTPYLILDDEPSRLASSWGRLAWCRPTEGLSSRVVTQALAILNRPITEDGERKAACEAVLSRALFLQTAAWLSEEKKADGAREHTDWLLQMLTDRDFLGSAYLQDSMVAYAARAAEGQHNGQCREPV